MFTGLVEICAPVVSMRPEPPGCRLAVAAPFAGECALGDSVAVNGCCLTVVAIESGALHFELGPETLDRTNLGRLQAGGTVNTASQVDPPGQVNLERSLRVGDRLGGHFVTGHIDGLGTLERRSDEGAWSTFVFSVPAALSRQMASKGSVAVDGVSLTLCDVEPGRFSVMLIPHTLAVTTLGQLRTGDTVNIETDLLAKYVQAGVTGS
jgi:riboflavin synthase